VLPKPSNLLLP